MTSAPTRRLTWSRNKSADRRLGSCFHLKFTTNLSMKILQKVIKSPAPGRLILTETSGRSAVFRKKSWPLTAKEPRCFSPRTNMVRRRRTIARRCGRRKKSGRI
ncbi:hypothetical protein I656_02321 [Geobacillus sp. WSUCF1]|nr:hypothetical protein I656_02321 [Geobacillus sp. WSUCF1]